MSEFTTVSARIDTPTKMKAGAILSSLGITHSSAISALYSQIVLQNGLPFDVKLPQAKDIPLTFWTIRNAVVKACGDYGVKRAWLFGSYARGDATPSSDIDIRIDKGDLRGMAIGGFAYDLEHTLGVSVDVVTTASLSGEFLSAIGQDEVLLYEAR